MFPDVVALFKADHETEYNQLKQQRKKTSTVPTSQLLTDEALSAFSRLLSKAKKAATEAQAAEARLFRALEDMCIDLDTPTNAENASNLGEAISCYLAYDEFSHKGIMSEVRALYCKEGEEC